MPDSSEMDSPPAAVLAGINTPLSGISIAEQNRGISAVTVSSQSGALTAAPSPGASVIGNGTHSLTIIGTLQQINAKLATLVYLAANPGADVLLLQATDPAAEMAAITIPIAVLSPSLPDLTGATIAITAGTITLETQMVSDVILSLDERPDSASSATIVLVNTTLSPTVTLAVTNEDTLGQVAPRLAVAGQVALEGQVLLSGGPTLVTLALGSTLINSGLIAFENTNSEVSGPGAIQNDGTISIVGSGLQDSPAIIGAALTGAGTVSLTNSAYLELGPVGAAETIAFDPLGAPGGLRLDQAAAFAATISGLSTGDRLELAGVDATALTFTQTAPDAGTLGIFEDGAIVATLRLAGSYASEDFQIAASVSGSTISVDLVSPSPAPQSVNVYRFFDQTSGAELLTPSLAESDAILASRPDLIYEGAALHALDPAVAGADAVPVYRFFATGSGSYFYTANETEKALILATRPDFAFEPDSTFYEHAAQMPGDVPVFRFFETSTGTHFYTADAGERANLLVARPDFVREGVAFYASAN